MTWRHWVFCCFMFYYMVSMYGAGIERGKLAVVSKETEYIQLLERHKQASQMVIDALLIDKGDEPMFNTREGMRQSYKDEMTNELFRQENWLDG